MGNREDLLAGARRCLDAKGYARTTIRDITEAAGGVSMAAVGYHYGSKEALLNAALIQATEEWGEQIERALAAGEDPGTDPMRRFADIWTKMIESLGTHRQLWAVTFELLGQLDHSPRIREQLTAGLADARAGLARVFHELDPAADEKRTWAVGSFYQALLTGVMAQWLIDPAHAPSGEDLAGALETITASLGRRS